MPKVKICPDATALARAAAEHFVALSVAAVNARGRFAVALSGGSTPKALYSLLATDEFAAIPTVGPANHNRHCSLKTTQGAEGSGLSALPNVGAQTPGDVRESSRNLPVKS